MTRALRNYIKLIVSEAMRNAHVAGQLVNVDKDKGSPEEDKDKDSEEEVEEMSTVAGSLGGGGGYTAPLGLSGQDVEGPASKGERKKRKKPSWS
jgi:hypothetical protein